jgi:outer membrane protein assembly factor BamA
MICQACLRFGILVLFGTLFSPRLGYAQSQGCVDSAPNSRIPVQKAKISIVGVEFQGENPLSDALRARLVEDIQHSEHWVTPEEPDSSWVSEALNPMRDALREQGYFKTDLEGAPYLVRALATERLYVLRVEVESGPKYRLGNIRFGSASDTPLVFTDALLRQQIRLQEGEVFDVTKIRQGLESISKLYGSKGYIDATPAPDTTIDEKGSRIDLLIRVDEQQPYHIAKIEFLGLQTTAQKYLKFAQEIGDVFNATLWMNFFEDNKSHLPEDASSEKNIQMGRNVGNHTIDITLDFRPCPKTPLLGDSRTTP